MTKHFDYCILGAGLAGISLAHELSINDASICLIDPNGIASGASGTPLGLVNPATGRYATLSWKAEECYSDILENLSLVQNRTPNSFFKNSGVLRPALDEKIASRMKENFETLSWPANWIEWLDEANLTKFHQGISCVKGGVWLPVGLTVDISLYLKEFVHYLISNKVNTIFGIDYSIQKKENYWVIDLANDEKIITKKIVFTTGSSTSEFDIWKDIPLYPVKGQLAVLEVNSPLSFTHAVSALGYIASLTPKKFVIGSTYEHSFDNKETDEQGLNYLLNRFKKVLPKLYDKSKVIHQWTGIRASTPNRMPIMGSHPLEENLIVFTGLGSKGLLYSAYLSKQLTTHLLMGTPLPPEVDINRFK